MLSMIREGANFVLSMSDAATIPDETIETILERSKEKDKKLEGALESLGESSLRNFTMDANGSVYNFEGQNYR